MESGALKTEDTKQSDGKQPWEVDVPKLSALYQECLTRPYSFYSNQQQNRDARYNYWPGQTLDHRKWAASPNDGVVLPWPGASDLRVPMVDGYVNEDVALSVISILRGNISASPVKTQAVSAGKHATNILKWMLQNEMTEFNREVRLLANYHFERGKAVLGTYWERQVQMAYEELNLTMIQSMAQNAQQALAQDDQARKIGAEAKLQNAQLPEGAPEPMPDDQRAQLTEVAALPEMILDEQYEDRLVELVQEYATMIVQKNFQETLGEYGEELLEDYELKPKTARRVIAELREDGKAKFPVPSVVRNRPVFVALTLDENFFVPGDGVDMENARAQFRLDWLTEGQIREKVVSEGWNEDWAEYVIKHAKGTHAPNASPIGTASASQSGTTQAHGLTLLDVRNLYGILHCYEKRCNEDGVPGIYYTVLHAGMTEMQSKNPDAKLQSYAKTELLNYAHGEYPHTLFRREFLSRRVDDSRGYGEVAFGWQKQIKSEMDMKIDRSTLSTNPPLHHPKGRPPTKWGPGVKVPGVKSDFAYAEIPPFDQGSTEVINEVRAMADRYFGRQTAGSDPTLAGALRQDMINNWLDGWKLAITQMWQLMQQFMPDSFTYKVVGSAQGQSIHATREEIQGKFDITVKFGVETLDQEALGKKIAGMTDMVKNFNVNGIVDFNAMLAMGLSWIDPDLPEIILKPAENATQQEVEDEKNVWARMWAGVGTDVKPGQAYQLRLEVLEDCLAGKDQQTGEPKNPGAVQRYQQDPKFQEMINNRRQQLQHQLDQRENAVTGRLGDKPNN